MPHGSAASAAPANGRVFPDGASLYKIMNRPISLLLLIGGIILLVYGINALDSIGSSFSRFFTGSPTDKTMWLLIGGAVAASVGAAGLLRGSRAL
jgi:hypothetical protein